MSPSAETPIFHRNGVLAKSLQRCLFADKDMELKSLSQGLFEKFGTNGG